MSTALHCTAFVLCVLILACAAARVVRRREPVARKSAAGAAAWLAALVAFAAYDAAGMVRCDKPWPAPLALVLLAGAAALSLAGPSLRDRLRAPLAALRPLVAVACVPLALFLLEWPYNGLLFEMEGPYVRLNLQLVGAALLAFWFVCQRRTGALVAFLAASLGVGLADYFVCLFKGQTILPADVLALSTAAEVGANYSFVAGDSAVEAVCAFVAAAALVSLFPSPRLTRVRVAFNLVVGLALASSLVAWYQDTDIRERYDVSVDVFFTRESYEEYGTVPSFLQRMQEVEPEVPAGYSAEAALSVQSELAAAWDEAHPDYPATLEDAAQAQLEATGSEELPAVVAIMNEVVLRPLALPGGRGLRGDARLRRHRGVRARVALRERARRRHLQHRVRVSDRQLARDHGWRRVPLHVLRPRPRREPAALFFRAGLRHDGGPSRKPGELEARRRVRAHGLRPLPQRGRLPRGRGHPARHGDRPRDLRPDPRPARGGRATPRSSSST